VPLLLLFIYVCFSQTPNMSSFKTGACIYLRS